MRNAGLSRLIDETRQIYNGRLRTLPNVLVLIELLTSYDSSRQERGHYWLSHGRKVDDLGRAVTLVNRPSVECPDPARGDRYPQTGGHWQVPLSDCRECSHQRKPIRGANYTWCAIARQQRGGEAGLAKRILEGGTGD